MCLSVDPEGSVKMKLDQLGWGEHGIGHFPVVLQDDNLTSAGGLREQG